jgi:hypothetical protein
MKPMRGLGFKIEVGPGNGGPSSDQDGDPFEASDVQGVAKRFALNA